MRGPPERVHHGSPSVNTGGSTRQPRVPVKRSSCRDFYISCARWGRPSHGGARLIIVKSMIETATACRGVPGQLAMRTPIIAAALILTGLVWVPAPTIATDAGPAECVRPSGVQRIMFSPQKSPNVRRHFRGAVRRGWPRRLVVNRRGADGRRERVLQDIPTRGVSIVTSTPQRLAGGAGPGWSAVATRAAGRPTCATCRALGTDLTAQRLETGSNPSATAPAFATCSADSMSWSPSSTNAEIQAHRPARPPRHRRIGSSSVARLERSRCSAHAETALCSGFVRVSDGTRTRDRLDHNHGLANQRLRVEPRDRPRHKGRVCKHV
jgi:hypothetical protein